MTSTNQEQIFKTDRRGRVRVPEARRRELLEEFGKSGMSGSAFARHYGLKYQTFANWLQKQRKAAAAEPAQNALGPVRLFETVVESGGAGSKAEVLVVELPGGGRLRIENAGQAELAAALLARMARSGAGRC